MNNEDLPQSGDVLAGKYAIEHVVGEGGMCVVYAAKHLQLQQRVALKVLRPDVAHRAEAVERFMREGRAAIRIRSEYCVRILDVGILDAGDPFIVMEHLEGSDLETLILANGPSPVTPAVDYILQASEAIAEAHTLGIVHRDLKPANLFFTRRADGTPWIKVLDFGISKVAPLATSRRETRLTGRDTVMGSPQYMSPEQLRATRDVDARADIWSLGAILHELLSGASPFEGDTVTAVCASIMQDEPKPLSKMRTDVPAGLENAVLRCLEKDPERRFATMAELAVALSDFASPAGRASAQRVIGILQSASEGPAGGILVHANEKTAWGSTDPSWNTENRKRRSLGARLAKLTATTAILAAAAYGAVLYAGTKGIAVSSAVGRIASLVDAPKPAPLALPPTPTLKNDHPEIPPPPPVANLPSPSPAGLMPAPTSSSSVVVARPSPPPPPPPPVLPAAPHAQAPQSAPLPSPAFYLPPVTAATPDEPPAPPVTPAVAAPLPVPASAPPNPDGLFDGRK